MKNYARLLSRNACRRLAIALILCSCLTMISWAQTIEPVIIPLPVDTTQVDTTTPAPIPVIQPVEQPAPVPTPTPQIEAILPSEKPPEPPCVVAYAIGFGLSSGGFTNTVKTEEYTTQIGVPPHDTTFAKSTVTDDVSGYSGIYFHFHVVKPDKKIYFSPNVVYCYEKKSIAGLDSYRRYIFLGGNIGINLNPLLPEESRLLVETFLEGGLGVLSLEDGIKNGDSNWHFLMAAMDIMVGGRYWISPDLGVEATFRYINCFLDSGLNSNNPEHVKEYITFNDYKFGIGLVIKP